MTTIKKNLAVGYISKAQAIERLKLNFPISQGADNSRDRHRYMQALADLQAIKELPLITPRPRWIPVSERLPEDDKDVLIFTIDESIYKACHSLKEWTDELYEWFVIGTLGWSLAYEEDEVLAWMPLPEPYKAEIEPQESEDKE